MKPFDTYHGFNLYKISDSSYIARNGERALTANTYHDIYATVYLHTEGQPMKQSITFASGQTLSVGDTFYFVHPEYRDGTITECLVDSFWPEEYPYGDKIRFTTKHRCEWEFVFKRYFERENPTCFVNYEDAKKRADALKYSA